MSSRILLLSAALLAAFASAWVIQGWRYTGEIAQIRAEHAEAYAQAERQARSEEARRAAAVEGIRRDAQERIVQLEADADTARAAAGSLREELARRRRTASDTGATPGSPPALSALILYSELLERADEAAGRYAEHADRARAAGLTCEQAFDSLTQKGKGM